MKSKIINKIISLAAALMLTLTSCPPGAYAASGEEAVVVGVNPDYGIFSVGGNYSGFALDYLREIKKRTGQNFAFVEGTAPELAAMLPESKRKAALAVLAEDPRPAYHDDERRYGVSFAGYDIRFHVKDRVLTVCEVVPLKNGRQPI